MNRFSKSLFVAAASLAMTGVAFAQDPAGDPPADPNAGGDAGASAGAGASVGPDGATVDANASANAGAGVMLTTETWPTQYILRTLNAAKGMLEVGGFLNIGLVKDSDTTIGVDLQGRYGINEKLEALFAYQGSSFFPGGSGITLSPDSEFKGTLALGVGYSALQGSAGGKLDLEPKGAVLYDLLGESAVLAVGADVRYKISDKLWIGTPQNRPGLVVTLKGQEIAIPMVGTIEISPIFFDLPLGIGFQVNDNLHLQANTQLFRLALNDDAGDSAFIAADFLTLDIEALYAVSNKLDIRAKLNLGELKDSAGDFTGISIGAAIRL
jgi:hypothetical protein